MQIIKPNFFILTGGPGVGKTTLIDELQKQNMNCTREVAREIIQEQVKLGGEALPWKNKAQFAQLMLERSIDSFIQFKNSDQLVFFDRGLLDTLCYARLIDHFITDEMDECVRKYRYNRKIFILPPWREIYTNDEERKQTWEEAVIVYEMMKDTYLRYGYELLEVPKTSVWERVSFILKNAGMK